MRGSSDLAGYWESAITVKKRDDAQREIQAEHREAEASPATIYRADFDSTTNSVRLNVVGGTARAKVAAYLADHPDASANEVVKDDRDQPAGRAQARRRDRGPMTAPDKWFQSGNHPRNHRASGTGWFPAP